MADRLPQYPMMPNFGSVQQQQQAQLQQQHHQQSQQQQAQQQHLQQQLQQQQHGNAPGQQQLQEQHGGMQQNQPAMDQNRAWQAAQMYQLANRPNGGEMSGMNPQMQEMLKQRMQNAARQQQMLQNQQAAQQQQQHQQQQQGFMPPAMGGGPMIGASNQQQPFHEPTASHPQAGHMAPAFPNIGAGPAGNVNPGQSVPRTPQQQPGMLRQLDLITAAQNQQNQNGPVKVGNNALMQQQHLNQLREHQQQQQQQQQQQAAQQQHLPFQQPHNPGDIFSQGMPSDAMRRPSPHPSAIQQTPSAPGGPSQPNVMATFAMQRIRLGQMEKEIMQFRQQFASRGPTPEENMKLRGMTEAFTKLREQHQRIGMTLAARQQQQMSAGAGPNPGPGPGSQLPNWNGPQQQQPFPLDMQAMRNPAGALGGQPNMPSTTPMQASASLPQPLNPAQNMLNQGLVPQRTGPTPQQQTLMGGQPAANNGAPGLPPHGNFNSPFNNATNLISAPFPPNGSQSGGGPGPAPGPAQLQAGVGGAPNLPSMGGIPAHLIKNIPPFDKTNFDNAYKPWSMKQNIPNTPLTVDGRTVDLHRLHVEVMKEGGWPAVDARDLWTVIGARLGFISFPGSDTEPARSGPVIGQQIQNGYKTYLAAFDQVYLHGKLRQQFQQQGRPQPPDGTNQFNNGNGGPPELHKVDQFVRMAQLSITELKAQNVDDKTIQYIEQNRANLQRQLAEHRIWSAQLKRQQQDQGGMPPGGPGMAPRPGGLNAPPFPQSLAGSSMMTPQQQQQQQQQLLIQRQLQQQMQQFGPQGQRAALPQTGSQHPTQMPLQPMLPNGAPGQKSLNPGMGQQLIQKLKSGYFALAREKPPVDVPHEHRVEFNTILESLNRQATEMDVKVTLLASLVGASGPHFETLKKWVEIIMNVALQRQVLSVSAPRYFIDLPTLKNMNLEFGRYSDAIQNILAGMTRQGQRPGPQAMTPQEKLQQMHFQAQLANRLPMGQPPNHSAPMQPQQSGMQQPMPPGPHPPQHQLPPQQQQPPQPPYQQIPPSGQPLINGSLRQPPALLQPPMKRKPQGNGAASSPSPAPVQASTPATSAPTPTATASSPPAGVKSPKTRPTPKAKPAAAKQRRPSKAAPPNPSAAASAVEQSPSASGSAGSKRPREDDGPDAGTPGALSVAAEQSPPKRAKTEWESEPTDELKKEEEAVANLKTEEDVIGFMDQMKELISQDPHSLTSGLSETLDIFLKGIPSTAGDLSGGFLMSDPSGSGLQKESSPPPDFSDQFFDFSNFQAGGEEDFKVPTPDLVSSVSSTNPSPESNHEDAAHHALAASAFPDIKSEDTSNLLGIGPWKDLDSSEAIFFQPPSWSWDAAMPSLDPPWAISNS